jgi:nitroreductase
MERRREMEFTDVIKNRYSCKSYNGEQITKEQLDAILEAGRVAPTAKNLQEQHIYVIQSEEGLAKIDKLTPCRYGAPTVLAVAYDRKNVFTYPGEKYTSGVEDATIVATHLLLAAFNAGVDSCWLNFFDPDALAAALGLPENQEIVMLLDLGYASEKGKPLPNHNSRKDITETVHFE